MTSDQRKFEHLAGLCDCLAQNASTPEQRESLLDLADKWRAIATSPKIYEVPPRAAHRSAVNEWLSSAVRPVLKSNPARFNAHLFSRTLTMVPRN
jgi:hypothetical protein